MTDEKALREKLDAMVHTQREKHKRSFGMNTHHLVPQDSPLRVVALDLLREKEQREMPCVWVKEGPFGFLGFQYKAGCGQPFMFGNKEKFCPGCGHPVQVKQPQDAAEEVKP